MSCYDGRVVHETFSSRGPLRSPSHRLLGGGLALAAWLGFPAPARAAEHAWHVGGELGFAQLFSPDSPGFGGGVHVKYGINDTFNLVAQADLSIHPGRKWIFNGASVGAEYIFDVIQWVPYVGAQIGGAYVRSMDSACGPTLEPCEAFRLNLQIPFGIDYQVSRSFTLGVAGRFQVLPGDPTWTVMGGFVRAEYVWGF